MVLYVLVSGRRTRVAFVSSRSVGGAVHRNRARRLLREAWRSLLSRVREGYDVVVLARPDIRGARMQDVAAEMAEALQAAGVITE
jgi:ribonuclease P protein component